jgi:hypothetical protein
LRPKRRQYPSYVAKSLNSRISLRIGRSIFCELNRRDVLSQHELTNCNQNAWCVRISFSWNTVLILYLKRDQDSVYGDVRPLTPESRFAEDSPSSSSYSKRASHSKRTPRSVPKSSCLPPSPPDHEPAPQSLLAQKFPKTPRPKPMVSQARNLAQPTRQRQTQVQAEPLKPGTSRVIRRVVVPSVKVKEEEDDSINVLSSISSRSDATSGSHRHPSPATGKRRRFSDAEEWEESERSQGSEEYDDEDDELMLSAPVRRNHQLVDASFKPRSNQPPRVNSSYTALRRPRSPTPAVKKRRVSASNNDGRSVTTASRSRSVPGRKA